MTDIIENYNLTIDALSEIRNRVINNKATEDDYRKLDFFLSAVNLGGYILKNLAEKGYTSYRSFIDQKTSNGGLYRSNRFNEAFIDATILECINMLYNFLNKSGQS